MISPLYIARKEPFVLRFTAMSSYFSNFRPHLPFAALLIVLSIYLGLKTFPEEGWSGWEEGSAQTLLTLEHWDKEGAFHHKLLFIPIGMSGIVKHLDEPGLRQHARGTVTGYLIGRRLYYTHYPPGYLFPFALLKKAGVDERYGLRLFSLSMSLAALVLMYAVFNGVSNPVFAFIGVLYYAGSTMFLDYADSLANQPLDDLLRFGIIFLSLFALKRHGPGRWKYTAALWSLYLILAASSYDSVLFIFIWLVGLDYAEWLSSKDRARRPIPLKRWLLFASAPVITFTLQFFQNLWYLGWSDLMLDIKGVLLYRLGNGSRTGKFLLRGQELLNTVHAMTGLAYYALPALALLAASAAYLKKRVFGTLPGFRLFVLFLVAGAAFTIVFAQSVDLKYQGRQLAPAIAFLVAMGSVVFVKIASGPRVLLNRKPAASVAFFVLLTLSLSLLWYGQAKRTVGYVMDWPNNVLNAESMRIFKEAGRMSGGDMIVAAIVPDYKYDNPQPLPRWEYYSGRTVLAFKSPELFLKDLRILKKRADKPFDVAVVTSDPEIIQMLMPLLGGRMQVFDSGYYALFIKDPVVPEGIFTKE